MTSQDAHFGNSLLSQIVQKHYNKCFRNSLECTLLDSSTSSTVPHAEFLWGSQGGIPGTLHTENKLLT